MKISARIFAVVLLTICWTVPSLAQKEKTVPQHAAGAFDVKVEPQGDPDKADGSTLARYSLDKQYHGDLEATAKGTMLTAGTDVKGSAGYVAHRARYRNFAWPQRQLRPAAHRNDDARRAAALHHRGPGFRLGAVGGLDGEDEYHYRRRETFLRA